MRVNAPLIKTERERRAWSQEHLAMVAGLGLRTVQRIETSGIASYESVKAIAAAYDMTTVDLTVEKTSAPVVPAEPVAPTTQAAESPGLISSAPAKTSSEWQQRPAWVRAIFVGSTLVRMDRQHLQTLERCECVVAVVLAIIGFFALFDPLMPPGSAAPLFVASIALFAMAYVASLHISIGDKFAVWPWLETAPRSSPQRFAFSIMLLLVLSLPLWA